MNKNAKKDFLQLKFDTSTDKLACFIKKKPKLNQPESTERCSKNIRKKIKSCKEKVVQFQNDAFLETILSSFLTEEFGDRQEIKQLVKDSKLADQSQTQEDEFNSEVKLKKKLNYLQFATTDQNLSCYDFLNREGQYKLLIEEWKNQPENTQKNSLSRPSTRVNTEETPEHSIIQQNYEKEKTSQKCYEGTYQPNTQYSSNYVQYYPYIPYQQPVQRKRRTVTNEQALQYKINIDNLQNDSRTTLMIRNIPNKYTQELLLEELRHYPVRFDFFYLPIDYNNSCNVGYAFINFIHNKFILEFYQEFNGRKWNRFNSQKICSLAYARIQGTSALRNHFRNSHVMQQKDKRYRPLISSELGDDQRNNLSKIIENQKYKI